MIEHTNSNFNIRIALIHDTDEIYNIENRVFIPHYWSKKTIFNELQSDYSVYFVYEDLAQSKKIIGYIGYWKISNEGHITTLAIDPLYRKRGFADKLLYKLITHARENGIRYLTLEVRASNIAAINLYKKHSFNQIGVRKKYYQNNDEDALIFWSEDIRNEGFKLKEENIKC